MKKIIVMSDAAKKNDILLACLKVFFPECEVEIRLKNEATMDRSLPVQRARETIKFENAGKHFDRG